MAREHKYEVQKGNEVRTEFVGKTVSWMKAQTIGEALGLPDDVGARITKLIGDATKTSNPHFESEHALVAAGEQQRDIAVRDDIRTILGKPEGTLAEAAKAATELTIGAPRTGNGSVSKTAKPATRQKRAAADTGNKVFERCLTDEKFRNTMERAGMLDGFEEWKAAREAAQAEPQVAQTAAA